MSADGSSTGWFDLIGAVANSITAIAAVVGVVVAVLGLDRWRTEMIGRRRIELAEDVLADFYRARDVIRAARSPLGFAGEGESRKRRDDEDPEDASHLDALYAVIERLNKHAQFFAEFEARRYRFMAVFGEGGVQPYEKLFEARGRILTSVHMLMTTSRRRERYREVKQEWIDQERRWESDIGWGLSDEDAIASAIDEAVLAAERLCRPVIDENVRRGASGLFGFLNRPKK